MQTLEKRGLLSGFWLKRIAVISMLIDHFGSIILDGVTAPYMVDGAITFTADMPWLLRSTPCIRSLCEVLGSIAFPIFCFLIVQGFVHTRSRMKYGLRLGLFALISEIPYDLAHYQTWVNFRLQNVMFTLCVGVFTLLAIAWVEQRFAEKLPARIALTAAVLAAGMGLAFLIRGEYVFLGVAAMAALYLLRGNRWLQLLGFAPLLIVSPWILLALLPAALYNGTRGRGSKYFFYVFYPSHFLLFAGIAWLLANRVV